MKYVYSFNEGNANMRELLGGKGANLAEMTNLGLPVPRGFTITTEACNRYYENNKTISNEIINEINKHIKELERVTGKRIGDGKKPLLVSVRSGARASMPGMMDSIHFLGMNDEVAKTFAEVTKNPRFVYDTYRRFIQTYSDIAEDFEDIKFEQLFEELKKKMNVLNDTDLTEEQLKEIIKVYKDEYKKRKGKPFPSDFNTQLLFAVRGVFESWNGDRAIAYRKINDIPDSWGTAVNVQENVFGNMNDNSGTGVAFTRNPATGEKKLFGEYLINAQGDDVVAGLRTPEPIDKLKEQLPHCYKEFTRICDILEKHYKDMQDMEFTIEDGKLFMLQTRNAKRTTQANIKVAIDLVKEKMITKEEALLRVDPKQLEQLLHPTFSQGSLKKAKVIGKGLAASPGAATGKIYFSAEDVKKAYENGEKDLLLVRLETSPEDIEGMHLAHGVLTIRGGMTSHAAVVARGMGTCCVSGCEELIIDERTKSLKTAEGTVFKEGDWMSLDGSTGNVYGEKLETVDPSISGDFEIFMKWADSVRRLGVRTNADNPKDAMVARKFGAEGIGLCRTEHMFFDEKRIFNFRKMIVADTKEKRVEALNRILPYQRKDFEKLFEVMAGYPVVIRYLDPPLHEFLPHTNDEINLLANALNMPFKKLKEHIQSLKEFNPMMGHRGCRLAITYPEIAEMQTRAVIEAAIKVSSKGIKVKPEIMIPLVGDVNELKYVKNIVMITADELIKKANIKLKYSVGTMLEVPRAAVTADEIAKEAEFFSFGTNDLTQMSYGFSRDDAAKFLDDYYEKGVFVNDPFARLDQNGVGKLIEIAVKLGKETRPNLHLGICGEHGGDSSSVEFCDKIGLDYVSCSPYRIPVARLAAAQANLANKK